MCVCEVALDVLPGPKSSENSILALVLIMDRHKQLRMCQHGRKCIHMLFLLLWTHYQDGRPVLFMSKSQVHEGIALKISPTISC